MPFKHFVSWPTTNQTTVAAVMVGQVAQAAFRNYPRIRSDQSLFPSTTAATFVSLEVFKDAPFSFPSKTDLSAVWFVAGTFPFNPLLC